MREATLVTGVEDERSAQGWAGPEVLARATPLAAAGLKAGAGAVVCWRRGVRGGGRQRGRGGGQGGRARLEV